MSSTSAGPWVPLADVARPHGVKGELRLKLYNRDSDLLLDAEVVLIRLADGAEREVPVVGARRADDAILLRLQGVDDRDQADALRGARVCVRRADFPPLEPDEFYVHDIEGARVLLDGAEVGEVIEFRSYPTVDVLVVEAEAGLYEVPLVDTYVDRVDPAAGQVVLLTLADLDLHRKRS